METKPEVELQFGNLEMLFVEAPFDQAKSAIDSAGGKIATVQQVAQARMVGGKEHHVSQYGSWTAENFIYNPEIPAEVLVTPLELSPILKHASEATETHRNNKEYFISKEDLADITKEAKEGKVFILENNDFKIPVSKFAKDELAQFLFDKNAQPYASLLREAGIKEVPVWLVDDKAYVKKQKAPFARPLWFHDLDSRSDLGGGNGGLNCSDGARGVRVASEASMHPYVKLAEEFGVKSAGDLRNILKIYSKTKELYQK
jgi:hypothetical protein